MLSCHGELHSGHNLRVARMGLGPAMIMLHGYPDNLQIWSNVAPMLAAQREVIAFDWPGMGRSDVWPGGATPFDMARRLTQLMDAWDLERAALVAHDMGGQAALAFAADHPERVSHLIVMNSLVIWDEKTSWEIDLLRRFGWNRFLLEYLPRPVFARAIRTFLPRGYKLSEELRRDFWDSFHKTEVRRFIVRMCAGYQGTLRTLRERYSKVKTPTLLLWAGKDKHFPVAHARKLATVMENSQVQEIAEAEHWMALHLAEEVALRIDRFLSTDDA